MTQSYLACFPTEEGTQSFWVFSNRADFIRRVLELLARERLDAWETEGVDDEPSAELEAMVQSFCSTTAPRLEAAARTDAAAFLDALEDALPVQHGFLPGRADGLHWAGAAVDFLSSDDPLAEYFARQFEEYHGERATVQSLEKFLDFLLEKWP